MGDAEEKPLKDRVADLEKEFQPFVKKAEAGLVKGDAAVATGAVTAVSGEANLVTGGVRLASFDFDLRQHLKESKLKADNLHPEGLAGRITAVSNKGERDRAVTDRAHERITDLSRDLNQKIRLKADKSDVGQANSRQNSQISGAQQAAGRAVDEVRRLYDEITRLNSRF